MAHVSFVIATYERPDVLQCTLRSLILQSHTDWTAIVVGDCCSNSTERAIRELDDQRIVYYNLPVRFGEQSGPNSVGLALANQDVVTFLNHDDLLLPDHIAYGLEQLEKNNADFFIGKAANATSLEAIEPVFTDVLPRSKDLRRLLTPPLYAFDPSSFWLIKTEYAKQVGSWRAAATIWRTPLGDWLLRAWRQDGHFVFGDRITGLRLRTHYLKGDGPLYDNRSPEHEFILNRIQEIGTDRLRDYILEQIQEHNGFNSKEPFVWARPLLTSLYKSVGFDAIPILLRVKGRKGALLRQITQKRTGADLPDPPSIPALIDRAASFRTI